MPSSWLLRTPGFRMGKLINVVCCYKPDLKDGPIFCKPRPLAVFWQNYKIFIGKFIFLKRIIIYRGVNWRHAPTLVLLFCIRIFSLKNWFFARAAIFPKMTGPRPTHPDNFHMASTYGQSECVKWSFCAKLHQEQNAGRLTKQPLYGPKASWKLTRLFIFFIAALKKLFFNIISKIFLKIK